MRGNVRMLQTFLLRASIAIFSEQNKNYRADKDINKLNYKKLHGRKDLEFLELKEGCLRKIRSSSFTMVCVARDVLHLTRQ